MGIKLGINYLSIFLVSIDFTIDDMYWAALAALSDHFSIPAALALGLSAFGESGSLLWIQKTAVKSILSPSFARKNNDPINNTAAYDKQYLEGRYGADPYLRNMLNWETEFVNGCEPVTVKHACYKFASVNSKSGCKTSFREECNL